MSHAAVQRHVKSSSPTRTILFSADLSGKTQTSTGAMGVSRQILSNMQNHYPVSVALYRPCMALSDSLGTARSRMSRQRPMAGVPLHDPSAAFRGVSSSAFPFHQCLAGL